MHITSNMHQSLTFGLTHTACAMPRHAMLCDAILYHEPCCVPCFSVSRCMLVRVAICYTKLQGVVYIILGDYTCICICMYVYVFMCIYIYVYICYDTCSLCAILHMICNILHACHALCCMLDDVCYWLYVMLYRISYAYGVCHILWCML
jgi:hypothetical protein